MNIVRKETVQVVSNVLGMSKLNRYRNPKAHRNSVRWRNPKQQWCGSTNKCREYHGQIKEVIRKIKTTKETNSYNQKDAAEISRIHKKGGLENLILPEYIEGKRSGAETMNNLPNVFECMGVT